MSTGVGMSSCCLSGSVHDGNPTGRVETIAGLSTYVSEPEGGSKAKTIVFVTDIFGYEFKNVRLLADNYAKAGFYCYIPDVHSGDSLPEAFLNDVEPPKNIRDQAGLWDKTKSTANVATTLGPWLVSHREAISKPIIEGFVNEVKMIPGTDKVGAIGFCWGGRYAILLAHEKVDAAFACHPSLVAVPADFEPVTKPLALAVGSEDSLLANTEVDKIKELLAKKSDVPSDLHVYEGQIHGFALRSDWSNEAEKQAMDDAEKQGKEWFEKYLS